MRSEGFPRFQGVQRETSGSELVSIPINIVLNFSQTTVQCLKKGYRGFTCVTNVFRRFISMCVLTIF